ncbi:MAG: DUF2085 domain-containing protein [Pseudomonadota bacterium]
MREGKKAGQEDVNCFILSHHLSADSGRCSCLSVGARRIAICSRCLGFYPALFLILVLHLSLDWAPVGVADWGITLLGVLPALADWGLCRLGWRGNNSIRILTGVLSGMGFGRALSFYFRETANEVFWMIVLVLGCLMP